MRPLPGLVEFFYRVFKLKTLRSQLRFWGITLVLVPSVILTIIFLYSEYESGKQNKLADMQNAIRMQQYVIENWFEQRETDVRDFSNWRVIKLGQYDAAYDRITQYLSVHKEFASFIFVDATGHTKIDPYAPPGIDVSDRAYFKLAKQRKGSISDAVVTRGTGKTAIIFAQPVFNQGNFHGVVLGIVGLETVDSVLTSFRTGRTGETYLVNKEGMMISESRFTDELADRGISGSAKLKLKVDTEGVRKALAGQNGAGVYTDYRGKRVLGAYAWIHDRQWAIITEIDEQEFLESYYRQVGFVGVAFLILVFLAMRFTICVSNRIEEPVRWLIDNVKALKGGTYTPLQPTEQRLSTAAELQELCDSFNQMAATIYANTELIKESNAQLAETEARYRTLVDESVVGKAFIQDNKFTYVNPRFAEIFGYGREELNVAFGPEDITHPEDRAFVAAQFQQFSQAEQGSPRRLHFEFRGLKKDGTVLYAEVHGVVSTYQGRPAAIASILDITLRKQAEEELKQTRDAALAASVAKSQFLATMSHEIRTPLNAIIGMADILDDTPLTPDQKKYIRVFRSAGENLLHLINDILDLSKVEAGNFDLEEIEFDLRDVIEKTCEVMALRAHEKNLELVYRVDEEMPRVYVGDPVRLRQVLVNIIGNAIKFTEKGEIFLNVEPGPRGTDSGRQIIFEVRDTGIGIPADKLEHIFDRFTQVDASTTRKYGGTGLGLAITKRLVELMGGTIAVKSDVNSGSVFTFTLPFAGAAKDAAPITPEQLTGTRIMVIDDNDTNRLIIRELLGKWGAVVSEAANGEEGISSLIAARTEGAPFDLVLLDCHMPGMDGFEVARRLKDEPDLEGVTVMMLTSSSGSADIPRCRELGIARHLIKPVKRNDLIEAISLALGQSKAPAKASTKAPKAKNGNEAGTARPLSILLVDDSPDNRLLVDAYLKKIPHKLDIAENGQEAIDKYSPGKYDLVLMDVQMPIVDGYTATRAIRNTEQSLGVRPVPIIALTAHAYREDEERSLAAGCNAHLTKPLKRDVLLKVITEYSAEAYVGHSEKGRNDVKETFAVNVDSDLRELIPGFMENRREDVAVVRRALQVEDYETIRIVGHTMKGIGSGYGFDLITEIGKEMEAAAKAADSAAVEQLVERLLYYIGNVRIEYSGQGN